MTFLIAVSFAGVMAAIATFYLAYRIWGSLDRSFVGKHFFLTVGPILAFVVVGISPVGYLVFDSYRIQGQNEEAIKAFATEYPAGQLSGLSRGETWIFNYVEDGQNKQVLKIGDAFLEMRVTSEPPVTTKMVEEKPPETATE
tara:strand:+ start:17747 stop:18172 length:426 start_codon:yes stop_codon:yes gene_type:complete